MTDLSSSSIFSESADTSNKSSITSKTTDASESTTLEAGGVSEETTISLEATDTARSVPLEEKNTREGLTLSSYARHLTNDMITLCVGENRVKYHVHVDKLGQLPFFEEALRANVDKLEYVEKTIPMPKDDPEAVAVLVEWLYIGKYAYNGNQLGAETIRQRGAPTELSEGLLEGLFHLEVCVVASEYQCKKLLENAKNQLYLIKKGLDDIDLFRLFKAQQTTSLIELPVLPIMTSDNRELALRGWVDRLFKSHRVEVYTTMREVPDLGISLLEACTSDTSMERASHIRKKGRLKLSKATE